METVYCLPMSGGCGWCSPLDYWEVLLAEPLEDAWHCGNDGVAEALNVVKTDPFRQGGVLCCRTLSL